MLVGIDTEADDQWSARGPRSELGVRNAERLPALQALFEEFGVRPTYLVTHEMATRPESAAVLRELAAGRPLRDRHPPPSLELAAVPARGPRRPHLSRTTCPPTCSSGSSAS